MKKFLSLVCILFTLIITAVSAQAACRVVAVMYHDIRPELVYGNSAVATPAQLESDIEYFKSQGYTFMTASELAGMDPAVLDGQKVVLLTFDDGYKSWVTDVLPILQRTGAKATMFVIGANVNRYGYLTESDISKLAHSGYVEIGNHTYYSHMILKGRLQEIYNGDGYPEIIEDIKANAKYLKSITGIPVTSFSWPYGAVDSRVNDRLYSEWVDGSPLCNITFNTSPGSTYYSGVTRMAVNRINRDPDLGIEVLHSRALK